MLLLLRPHERLVVREPQVSFKPNNINGLLFQSEIGTDGGRLLFKTGKLAQFLNYYDYLGLKSEMMMLFKDYDPINDFSSEISLLPLIPNSFFCLTAMCNLRV